MRQITKYSNRKLYLNEKSRYTNLQEVIEFIKNGEVVIITTPEGRDVTNRTLKSCLELLKISNEVLVDNIRKHVFN